MKRIILLAGIVILLASCQKVIDFDTTADRTIVVNGMPSSGKQLFVNLSNSHLFLDDNTQHPIDDAQVTLKVNGVPMSPCDISGCNYFFAHTAQDDDQIELLVRANGETITAHTYVPRMPLIDNMQSAYDTSFAFNLGMISFDLQDHPDYKDYYQINIVERDSGVRYNPRHERYDTIDTVRTTIFMFLNTNLSNNDFNFGTLATRVLILDNNIDGKKANINLAIPLLVDTNEVEPFLHTYTLKFEAVTPERYEYLKSTALSTGMTTSFVEPAPVYTNIEGNATGIFAGNASRQFQFTFERPEPAPTISRSQKEAIKAAFRKNKSKK